MRVSFLKTSQQIGQKAIEESTAVLNDQLNERIETLEQISSIQSRTITNLRDSSKIADQKVSSVVNSIEKTLSDAVPGFRLEAVAVREAYPRSKRRMRWLIADPLELEEAEGQIRVLPATALRPKFAALTGKGCGKIFCGSFLLRHSAAAHAGISSTGSEREPFTRTSSGIPRRRP